jgi:hypothetical protein
MTQIINVSWTQIFSDNPARLIIVVSTQSINADTTNRILACQDTYKYVKAVAIAPYFSTNMTGLSIDTLMNTSLPQEIQTINTTLKQHLIYTN